MQILAVLAIEISAGILSVSAQTVVNWGAVTNPPAEMGSVAAISAGATHFLALRSEGTVVAWGSGSCGQTSIPDALRNVIGIAAGEYHSLALKSDGSVESWACDTRWELNQVPEVATNVVEVAAGYHHSLALRADATIIAWGDNGEGQCDVPNDLYGVAVAAGGRFSLALMRDGTLAAWGDGFFGQCSPPAGLRDVVAIAAGNNHALALRADGTVVAWGDDSCGQCDVPINLTGVSAISAGGVSSLALKTDGTLVAWGRGAAVQVPSGLTNVIAIAAGGDSALALVGTQTPYVVRTVHHRDAVLGTEVLLTAAVHGPTPIDFQWYKDGGPLADNGRLFGTATSALLVHEARLEDSGAYSVVASIAGGIIATVPAQLTVFAAPRIERHPESLSQPLDTDALLLASVSGAEPMAFKWWKDEAPLADSERVSGSDGPDLRIDSLTFGDAGRYSIVASNAYGCVTSRVALVAVGQVDGWGENWCGELDIPPGLSNVVKVVAGGLHALALRRDGTVVAWGDNLHGQCDVPEGLNEVVAVAAGGAHSLALRRNGTVVGWGYSKRGLLNVPVGLDRVTAIAAGTAHSLALRADGTVVCWGHKSELNSEIASDLREIVGIAGGGRHSIALKANGTVFVWGGGDLTEPPASLKDVIAVAAGQFHSLALKADGTVISWGSILYPPPFASTDILDVASFAGRLKHPRREIDSWLAAKLTTQTKAALDGYIGPGSDPAPLLLALPMNLYWIVMSGTCLYESQRFAGIELRAETVRLLSQYSRGGDLACLNRLLLEDAYPLELAKCGALTVPAFLSNVVQIAAGSHHSMAMTRDRDVVAWGGSRYITAQPPSGSQNLVQTASGGTYALGLIGDGRPCILGQSVTRKVGLGQRSVLSAAVAGTEPLSDVWFKDGQPLVDGHGTVESYKSELIIQRTRRADGGMYRLVVSNALGFVTSDPIMLHVNDVIGWGDDDFGQADPPGNTQSVLSLSTGDSHTVALHVDGRLSAWGEGGDGQNLVPEGDATSVVSGGFHNVALRPDGTVVAWGRNRSGQCDVPPGLRGVIGIAAGRAHSLALRRDGTVVGWGRTWVPVGLKGVRAIAAGGYHSLALRSDGEIVAWGHNRFGQCTVPAGVCDIMAIAAGGYHSVALLDDGSMIAWGSNRSGQCTVPQGLEDAVMAAAGGHHSIALRSDGSVVNWGLNQSGQCNAPSAAVRLGAIAAGRVHSLAVVTDGSPKLLRPIRIELLSGGSARLTGYASGDTPMRFRWYRDQHVMLDGDGVTGAETPVLTLAPGAVLPGEYSVAISNTFGDVRVGSVNLGSACAPRIRLMRRGYEALQGSRTLLVADVDGAAPMALQWYFSGAIVAGEEGVSGSHAPVLQIDPVRRSHAGLWHLIATNAFGTAISEAIDLSVSNVRGWGGNRRGQSFLPYTLRGVKAISALADHAMALHSDGTVKVWGDNSWKQCDLPDGAEGVVEVAAGEIHSMILKADGTVCTWGGPSRGLHTLPTEVTGIAAIAASPWGCFAYRRSGGFLWWGAGQNATQPREPDIFADEPITSGRLRSILAARRTMSNNKAFLSEFLDIARGRSYHQATTYDGRVKEWRGDVASTVVTVSSLMQVIGLANGVGQPCLALSADGSVGAWQSGKPQNVTISEHVRGAVGAAVGRDFYLAVTEEGDVIGWGATVLPPPNVNGVTALSAGGGHSVALRCDRSIVAWGDNQRGQCDVPPGLSNVVGIAAGFRATGRHAHSLAVVDTGIVRAWGDNSLQQCAVPSTLTNAVAVAAGAGHSLALTADGSVVAWGDNTLRQCSVPVGLARAVRIAAGGSHSVALTAQGDVVCWGANAAGQCRVPDGLCDVLEVAAGARHTVALCRSGEVVGWGDLGNGIADIAGWSNIVGIAAGGTNTVGLRNDGSVVVAGDGTSGQREVPEELRDVDAIAVGDDHVLAAVGVGPLARAVGEVGLQWQTGPVPWVAQMQVTRDGRLAAQSGEQLPGEESWVEATVSGPGVLSFWWRTASSSHDDTLEVQVNGTTFAQTSGNTDWEPRRLPLPSGAFTVRWRYAVADVSAEIAPAAWLDEVTFELAPKPILNVTLADGAQLAIRFESIEGLVYSLQRALRIAGVQSEWTMVRRSVGTGQPMTFFRSFDLAEAEFYRIVVE